MFKRTKIKWDLKAINTQIVAFIQQTAERESEEDREKRACEGVREKEKRNNK